MNEGENFSHIKILKRKDNIDALKTHFCIWKSHWKIKALFKIEKRFRILTKILCVLVYRALQNANQQQKPHHRNGKTLENDAQMIFWMTIYIHEKQTFSFPANAYWMLSKGEPSKSPALSNLAPRSGSCVSASVRNWESYVYSMNWHLHN